MDSFASTGQDFIGYNMFAYCANNPIIYVDYTGEALDTVLDLYSFAKSISNVAANPRNPIAWLELAADTACLLFPCVSGGDSFVRIVTTGKSLDKAAEYADKVMDMGRIMHSNRSDGRTIHSLYMKFTDSEGFLLIRLLVVYFLI